MRNPTRRLAGGIAAVAASVLVLAGCTAGTNGSDAGARVIGHRAR